MKVQVTENQYKIIQRLNESNNVITEFKALCNKINHTVDGIFSRLLNVSVEDIIDLKVNTSELINHLSKLEDALYVGNKTAYSKIPQDDQESLDLAIDDLKSSTMDKINSLELLLNHTEEMANISKKFKLRKVFSTVKPTDITSLQK